MPAFQIVVAVGLLVGGTVVMCLLLALAARLVDRVWDVLATRTEDAVPPQRPRSVSARARPRVASGFLRSVLVALLASGLLATLAWLAFTVSRSMDGLR